MTVELTAAPATPVPLSGWRRVVRDAENWGVTLALCAMMLIPVSEIVLRKLFHQGISGAPILVQQLTFVVGMLGGLIAARERRLLALSVVTSVVSERVRAGLAVFSQGFAAAVTAFLCVASVQFVAAEIRSESTIAYGIKTWHVQCLLPAGFALIALRLWWHAATTWKGRSISLVVTLGLAALALWSPLPPEQMKWPALAALGVATLLGAPIFTALGGAAMILFWAEDNPIAAVPLTHYSLVTNPTLPTIPLFTLAGYFLAEGGASRRFVRVFDAVLGCVRGGPAIVTAVVCAFFTSFTGASGVTILALGGLLMPVLLAAKYSEREALGLLTGAGSLGVFLPPCLPLILYAIIAANQGAEIRIEQMFLGGALPALLMVGLTAAWGIWRAPGGSGRARRLNVGDAWRAIRAAQWELLVPVVAMVGLFGGFATPVEAAAVTAVYAFVVETVIYRDLKLSGDLPRVVTDCGLLVGGVLLILGVALGFTNFLVDAEVPARAVDWVKASIHSPLVFLLVLNVFLLVVGCLMDIYSAIVVVVPLLVPMGAAFGIDPIHLGIIFLANLQVGYLTPPVGMNLFLAAYRFGKPLPEVFRAVVPMLLVFLVGVLLITYVPPLTTWLPQLAGH